MAKIIKPATKSKEVARHKHVCGATVEFTKDDIRCDTRDGNYVICPACNTTPWINEDRLSWRSLSQQGSPICPKCGSTDITNVSQSFDCGSCGHSW